MEPIVARAIWEVWRVEIDGPDGAPVVERVWSGDDPQFAAALANDTRDARGFRVGLRYDTHLRRWYSD